MNRYIVLNLKQFYGEIVYGKLPELLRKDLINKSDRDIALRVKEEIKKKTNAIFFVSVQSIEIANSYYGTIVALKSCEPALKVIKNDLKIKEKIMNHDEFCNFFANLMV